MRGGAISAASALLVVATLSVAAAGLLASSSAEVASGPARAAQSIPASGWQIEQISGAERTPEDLSFDAVGHAMVTWLGGRGTPSESLYFGADVREPAGGWRQVPNPPIQSSNAHMYLYGNGLAQQIGTVYNLSRDREEVLAADGSISGTFATPRALSSNGEGVVSAADAAGDAIVAWTKASKPIGHGHGIVLAERTGGGPFSSPRTLTLVERLPLAVGLNPRGERVLVWPQGKALYARIRRPGQPWGPARLVSVRLPATTPPGTAVSVAISPSGTVVLAWEVRFFACGSCLPMLEAVVAVSGAHGSWRSFTLQRPATATYDVFVSAQIVALEDTAGRMYVTWNGVSHDAPVVKFARVGTHGVGPTTVLSTGVSEATLLDAAAGPRNALAVSWMATPGHPGDTPTYVSLRRNGQPFAAPAQVTSGAGGSGLVAFQPITGQAVVVSAERTGPQAAISPLG